MTGPPRNRSLTTATLDQSNPRLPGTGAALVSASHNLQYVHEEVDDVQVKIQGRKDVIIKRKLHLVPAIASHNHLGIENDVERKKHSSTNRDHFLDPGKVEADPQIETCWKFQFSVDLVFLCETALWGGTQCLSISSTSDKG